MKKQILTAAFIFGLAFFANAQTGEKKSTSGNTTTTGTVTNSSRPSPSIKNGDRTVPTSNNTPMKTPRGVVKEKARGEDPKKPGSTKPQGPGRPSTATQQ